MSMITPVRPPQTGLDPPTAPVVTLFTVVEQSFGQGQWLYYQRAHGLEWLTEDLLPPCR